MPANRERLTLDRVMSREVTSVKLGDSIRRAFLDMHVAGVRHLPVVDGTNRVVGIVSSRDLVPAITSGDVTLTSVEQVMTRGVRTARRSTPAHEAAAIMLAEKIGSLPIVDDEGRLLGIVTESDFLQFAYDVLATANEAMIRRSGAGAPDA